jgi:hypothetical protein
MTIYCNVVTICFLHSHHTGDHMVHGPFHLLNYYPNYVNQDYIRVNYTLIVVYSMLLVTGSQSRNISCFCLDMAQWRSLIGQSLCNAIYWSNMGFSVYWCSRWNGHIECIETTAYGVYIYWQAMLDLRFFLMYDNVWLSLDVTILTDSWLWHDLLADVSVLSMKKITFWRVLLFQTRHDKAKEKSQVSLVGRLQSSSQCKFTS